ncbi:phosphoribosyl-AMP cyclohydrolase [Komagataeibacter europaeus]|uniref:phosphoribosyl-AMP cyclohydrolase n=1 Tax=Komagataeibacter europaeus TaxID=33995 RepID=UPI0002E6D678|nr:phosphoribosyl-AMP cyclohydrolase [Komagataeibacter europaeus]GBQ39327.1 phosphoribosyl-AMP cyclohydrolase [Komagataeibacter europaeus LMG 18890]
MPYTPPDQAVRAAMIDRVKFNEDGLIAAIAQQHDSGEVLMLAWMNAEALDETLRTGRVCYYSRSRRGLWRKGETSGQVQTLLDARLDCDRDAVLLLVDQKGVACHTGRRSCFYNALRPEGIVEITQPEIAAEALYGKKA